jgi:hypothetical protein
VRGEHERRTCYVCRRRLVPASMDGSRCKDRDACLRAAARWVSASRLTGAERSAMPERRKHA